MSATQANPGSNLEKIKQRKTLQSSRNKELYISRLSFIVRANVVLNRTVVVDSD